MAHWAELDENNKVIRVTVGDNNDFNNDEGYQWLLDNLGGRWVKTSYNTLGNEHKLGGIPFRKNYAGIGFTYDEVRDAFIPPKPELKSFILLKLSEITEIPTDNLIVYDEKTDTFKRWNGSSWIIITDDNWVLNETTCLWELANE